MGGGNGHSRRNGYCSVDKRTPEHGSDCSHFSWMYCISGTDFCPGESTRDSPRLKFHEARSEGLYDVQDSIVGFTVRVENDQQRFHTIAHNVKASLEFRHSLGDVIKISPALWIVDGPEAGQRRLTNSVSIGMGELRSLLILFGNNTDPVVSALTTARVPLTREDASPLALGEWTVNIVLKGDNVTHKSKNRLSLGPHNVTMKPI